MKRSHSDMSTSCSVLPKMSSNDSMMFKSTLNGSYRLKVVKVTDISKPTQRPVDEIEEPEEDEAVAQNKMNKGNARMIQLDLKDSENQEIRALETERIEALTNIKPDNLVNITGPVDIRCGNIMLERKHLVTVETAPAEEYPEPKETKKEIPIILVEEDWEDWGEEDENDCIVID